MSGQLHAPATLSQSKEAPPPQRYPLDRRLAGSQSLSGRYGGEKKFAPAGNRTPTVQPVIWTEVSRLLKVKVVPRIRPRPLPSISFPFHYLLSSNNIYNGDLTWIKFKQEFLGRTNRILSLIRHGSLWKRRVQQFFYCWHCIRFGGNVSTEPLSSNDKGIFT
jgi:hypothetical protein